MTAYVTVVGGYDALLPYFLAYYSRIGVEHFVLMSYGREPRIPDGYVIERGPAFPLEDFHHGHRQRRVRELHRARKDNWSVHADLDEFVELPSWAKTLQDVIAKSEAPMICGRWLDRVARGGALQPIDPSLTLEEQYPMGAQVRQRLNMNHDCVVAANYAPLSHHPRRSPHWKKSIKLTVHHFKWQPTFVERMRTREQSQFVRGAHRKRVSRMIRETAGGVPKRWLKYVGERLGI